MHLIVFNIHGFKFLYSLSYSEKNGIDMFQH
jgi:hypothetical protein